MNNPNNLRRWQRGEKKILKQIDAAEKRARELHDDADGYKDLSEMKRRHAMAFVFEERARALKRRLAKLRADDSDAKQPQLFNE